MSDKRKPLKKKKEMEKTPGAGLSAKPMTADPVNSPGQKPRKG